MLRKSNIIQAYKSLLFLSFAVLLELSTKLVSVARSFAWLVSSSDQFPREFLIFFRAFELKARALHISTFSVDRLGDGIDVCSTSEYFMRRYFGIE